MNIDLGRGEIEILQGLLEKELDEIRSEVHHTQAREYREGLKEREEAIRRLLEKMAD